MKTTNRILAVTALSAALVAAPLAANAYVPGSDSSIDRSTVTAGEAVIYSAEAGFFVGGEDVLFTLTGENASEGSIDLIAAIDPADVLVETYAADADGSIDVSITTPEDAAGLYTLNVLSESGVTDVVTFTVEPADAGTTPVADGTDGLANTGANTTAAFWFAGGLLALGAALVIVLNVVRRNRAQA